MTPVQSSNLTTRLEQPNRDEAEENDLKNNFRRMFEGRNSLKGMEEKTNKKLEDINKSLKENKKKSNQMYKRTIQDLKTEIEIIKKTQTKGIIETEIMRK